jgi:catechol 2,3-dioxygenase-like lactoylglutathione lyase family enzyme
VAALDHVTISPADFTVSSQFYDAALGALGLVRLQELRDEEEDGSPVEAAAWGTAGGSPIVWLVPSRLATTGLHIALHTRSRLEVETFYREGVRSGGSDHTAPRRWPLYRRGEFHAIVRDPDGNLVEAISPE